MKSTVYDEGFKVGEFRDLMKSCPYDRRTKIGREWMRGYREGWKSRTITMDEAMRLLTHPRGHNDPI
jgi:hypothetical protein